MTRQSIDIMRREHARISGQITDRTTTREDLAYLIDTAAAFHRDLNDTSRRDLA